MSDSARFALHRPEFLDALVRGEEKICALLEGAAFTLGCRPNTMKIEHRFSSTTPRRDGPVNTTAARWPQSSSLSSFPVTCLRSKACSSTRHTDAGHVASRDRGGENRLLRLHAAYVKDSDIATRCIWQVLEEERRLHSWVRLGPGQRRGAPGPSVVDFPAAPGAVGTIPKDIRLTYPMPLNTKSNWPIIWDLRPVHVNRRAQQAFARPGSSRLRHGHVDIADLERLAEWRLRLLDGYSAVARLTEATQNSDTHP